MSKLTILLAGMVASDPYQGGATWAVLQYLLGLKRLGHDVYFVEPVSPKALRPASADLESSINARYFRQVAEDFDIASTSALLASPGETVGLAYDRLVEVASRADVLVNISGMLTDHELLDRVPARVYLDLDPAFNQLWHAVEGLDMRFAGHTHHVTVGLAISSPECDVPTCGVDWITTAQPIVLDRWPAGPDIVYDGLTTIGNWRGYGSIERNGLFYGQKAHSLRAFFPLPTLTDERFMPALNIHPGESQDLEALAANGWCLLDPSSVASTPQTYQQFIQRSKAEFGIAKSGYVVSRCGWFSDRSVCYLASGRPVIAQETGFSRYIPTGCGLFSFQTSEDALAAIEALNSEYMRHSRAARELAEECFDSDKVLTRFLDRVGAMS